MINLHERMLSAWAEVEPMTSWSPVGRASDWTTEAGRAKINSTAWNYSISSQRVSVPAALSEAFESFCGFLYLWDNIGIKHSFSCINIRQVPWEVLKTEAEGRGFQHLPRDRANVYALKNHVHVRSLLLHKNWKHLLHFALFYALFWFAFFLMSRERNFHGLGSF